MDKEKTIKVYYKGGFNEQKDGVIKQAMGRMAWILIGSGYNFRTGERDLEFEFHPVPNPKPSPR